MLEPVERGNYYERKTMIRKLKSLGLALVAVLAMSAVVASAAQAVPSFTASAYPATVTGLTSKGNQTFTLDHSTVQCDSHWVSNSLAAASSTLTVTPTYSNCEAFGFSATVNPEGCTYVFHATEQVAAGVYNHHVDVVCPTGKSIKISGGTCKAEIKAQNNRTTVTTTNLGGGSVTVQPKTSVSTTVTQDGFACPLTGLGTRNGTYHGDVVVSRVGGGSVSVSGS